MRRAGDGVSGVDYLGGFDYSERAKPLAQALVQENVRSVRAEARVQELEAALRELLDVAERIRGGDLGLAPERWYAARDFARAALVSQATEERL